MLFRYCLQLRSGEIDLASDAGDPVFQGFPLLSMEEILGSCVQYILKGSLLLLQGVQFTIGLIQLLMDRVQRPELCFRIPQICCRRRLRSFSIDNLNYLLAKFSTNMSLDFVQNLG